MFNLTNGNSDIQGVKCGEMFIIPDGNNYSIVCEFCGAKHNNFDILAEHVFDHLLKPPNHIKPEKFISAAQNVHMNKINSDVMPAVECLLSVEESITTIQQCEEITQNKKEAFHDLQSRILNEEQKSKKISKSGHQCKFCGKTFFKTKALHEHEIIHSGGRMPYECQECLKPFSSSKALRVHGVTHKEIERQMCSDCGRTFNNTGTLNIHIRERHLHDTHPRRLFPCRYCDKKFKANHQLYSHLKTHKKNTETFTCDHCQREFKSKRLIFAHMDNVHSKLHTCSVCSKAFRHKSHRDDHENTHTGRRPHQCRFCSKEFMNKAGLTRHNKIHASDGSETLLIPTIEIQRIKSKRKYIFECKICSKAFPYAAARDDHENGHTGRRPHQCRFCEKDFSTKRTLNYHIKNAHTNDEQKSLLFSNKITK